MLLSMVVAAHPSSPESDDIIEVIHTVLDIDESGRTDDIERISESDSLDWHSFFNGERTCPHSRTRFPSVVGLRRTCCFRALVTEGRAAYNEVRRFSCTHVGGHTATELHPFRRTRTN